MDGNSSCRIWGGDCIQVHGAVRSLVGTLPYRTTPSTYLVGTDSAVSKCVVQADDMSPAHCRSRCMPERYCEATYDMIFVRYKSSACVPRERSTFVLLSICIAVSIGVNGHRTFDPFRCVHSKSTPVIRGV